MGDAKQLRRNFLWNTFGQIIYMVCHFLFGILILSLAGAEQSGIFTTAISATGIFLSIASYGMYNFQVSDAHEKYTQSCYIRSRAYTVALASAVCMVRHPEPELFAMLPNAQELRNEFILLRERKTSVGYAIKAAGGKVIDVGFGKHVTTADIERAITPRTCAIVYCDTQVLSMKCPPLRTLTLLAHKHDLYMVVQASGQLPPKENLWHYTVDNGADLAIFAGGKAIRGAQQSGILVGRRALVDLMEMAMPPRTGLAYTASQGREEIISVYTALTRFLQPGQMEERLRQMRVMREQIAEALDKTMHFKTVTLYPGPSGQTYSWLGVEVLGGVSAKELSEALLDLDPGIVVGNWEWHNGITINPLNMEPEEVPVLIEGVLACYDRLAKGGKTA